MIPRRTAALLSLPLLALGARAEIQVAPTTFAALEAAAHLCAKGGHAEEQRELVALLGALGYAKDNAQKLSAACEKELAGFKGKPKDLPEAEAKLESAAAELALLLPALAGEELERVARVIVRLDDGNAAAHKALGDEATPEGWKRPGEQALLPRRARILEVLREAHAEPVEISTEPSTHELLQAMSMTPGSTARFRGIRVHAPWSPERTARVLAEALRACAVCAFLLDDERGIPEERWFVRPGSNWVLTDSRAQYDKALAKVLELGWLDAQIAEQSKKLWGFQDTHGNSISYAPSDAENAAAIFCWLAPLEDGSPSALKAGLYSWVCQAYLGTQLPGFTSRPDPHDWSDATYVKPSADEQKELDKRLQVAKAGLPGARSWMNWLVRRREDPPFSRCMVDFFGKLTNEDLLKCTSMIEFWQERGALRPILEKVAIVPVPKALETYARALGDTPAGLESKWRAWLLADEPSLCTRLGKQRAAPVVAGPEEELRLLLAALRTKCIAAIVKCPPVEVDPELSRGCRLHADYLSQNPAQGTSWPDVHGESSDKPGFSASGAWAAAHALVTPTKPGVRAALDDWMGTYFHRLPLIDPGLVRVGWGESKDYQVLDAHSLRRPPDSSWVVVWPHEEMQKVPVHANAELPSPVPGTDPTTLGYPITLQVGLPEPGDPPLAVALHLWEGNKEVECWFSSPDHPLEPRLVPQRSFALFPKQPLKPGVRYQVSAEWTGTQRKKSWFFRT